MDAARIDAWSQIPRLVHGFSRKGPAGESREETAARLAKALASSGRLFLLKQVHGAALALPPWTATPEADAAATVDPAALLGIQTADCLPALFVDPVTRRAAAAHAGWRGTASGIVRTVVAWFRAQGSRVDDVRVALGPSIGACCYEVGEELRAQFAPEEQRFFVAGRGEKPHLDVRGINEQQLRAAGIPPENVTHVRECTQCRADLYFSYRRDGAGTGRMISYVGWAP
jgi:YfiH family protein